MLNVAIIGTGNISRFHIEAYLMFPERCKITHLVDIFPEKASEKNERFGLGAKVFSSHKDILGDPSIDLVDICTPPSCHAGIAVDFLNAGKNVIVEKPMAASLEECDAMLEAAAKSGKMLSVIAQNRFTDPAMRLKTLLDSGKIGKIVHAQVESLWWRGRAYYDLWWRGLWEKEGGGCTLNHAVHHIDMLGWMMGRPQSVFAMLGNASHDNSEVEDVSAAIMRYENGTLAQVTSSVIHHGEEQRMLFQGEKASVSAPWKVHSSMPRPNGHPIENTELESDLDSYYNSLPKLPYTGHKGQIDNVLSALEAGVPPMIGGDSGRRTIELITAIYKSGSTGSIVTLPIEKDDPFYTVEGIMDNVPRFYEKTSSLTGFEGEGAVDSAYSKWQN